MPQHPRVPLIAAVALLAACGDDEPTGPTTEEVAGFEISVSHDFVHQEEDVLNILTWMRITPPPDVTLADLADVGTVQVDIPGLGSSFAANAFDQIEDDVFMTMQGPTRAEPLPSGTYVGLLRFNDTGNRWRFRSEVVSDPIPGAEVEPMVITHDEATFEWTPPTVPHQWRIELYTLVRDGTSESQTLVVPGTNVDGDVTGATTTGSVPLDEIEAGAMFAAYLVLTGPATTHQYRVDGVRPEG